MTRRQSNNREEWAKIQHELTVLTETLELP